MPSFISLIAHDPDLDPALRATLRAAASASSPPAREAARRRAAVALELAYGLARVESAALLQGTEELRRQAA